ncbi:DUF6786 family protein [Maribacter sp. 1_MG-2023]|uniref:DUF6786 family protein n=1 Tax=Maribacter sp. 1_MG-2023 TaxID=3062677 RepID=UPI0026E32B9C|nr:DUF6786 family protein [Maribacter sp. 1_MG-2023]MDO6470455.1 hypothetical protein [Maribacter sp. 1_MG-2023]
MRNQLVLKIKAVVSIITYLLSYKALVLLITMISLLGCNSTFTHNTFGSDLKVLNNIEDLHVLKSENSMIAVSGSLQGRVFTSSSNGLKGKSYGWFKREAVLNRSFKKKFSNLGGEDRMWFGPQYGKYNLFFESGDTFEDANSRIAPDLDTLQFKIKLKTDKEVVSTGRMHIKNYQNYIFNIDVERKISILGKNKIEKNLNVYVDDKVSYVGFETVTKMVNIGANKWSKETGLISIWILGCIIPTDNTVAIIPTTGHIDEVTNYFTPLDDSRMQIKDGFVYYKADANYLNKIGILPQNTVPVFGSYSPELNLLTIVEFSFENSPYYVNSKKENNSDPYGGDVINIFNDGVTPTAGPFGPFYEVESSSAAKELEVGEEIIHTSRTYHFKGDEEYLDQISLNVLGVKLSDRVKL